MPDGTRKRRFSDNPAKRRYYAEFRAKRFNRRFGLEKIEPESEEREEK